MTHSPDFSAESWYRKSAPTSSLCHTDLVPDFSGTRFWRQSVACSISCRFLVCMWPLRWPVIERNVNSNLSYDIILYLSVCAAVRTCLVNQISIDLQLNCFISDCVYWVMNEKTDCAWGLVIWHILTTRVNIWYKLADLQELTIREEIRCILTSKKHHQQQVLCTMSRLLITITSIDEIDSSIFASSMLICGADFSYQIDFWSVCHQLKHGCATLIYGC